MYIAINGEELVSAHRTYEGALVAYIVSARIAQLTEIVKRRGRTG